MKNINPLTGQAMTMRPATMIDILADARTGKRGNGYERLAPLPESVKSPDKPTPQALIIPSRTAEFEAANRFTALEKVCPNWKILKP
ncbi:hypothetical protein NX720_12165 [Endozoicomonas euniceicola]|uniref:Uncharacterized protein n=1 Tax=Endozoicomonas euniceicola TaxID=1234143 RepID=A0ABY6H307_9GAMM|nr:hypothetical protein [Endozoicomonas euniceicola]UYM18613.1 hypothetical protein NX720_12165 [Endozoicomonas euniceicola]